MELALEREGEVEDLARALSHARDFLYLGRGVNYPIALEGALKLKEISYIHAEGYPAGEMKHGPIALIDEDLPVVALAPGRPRLREDAVEHRGGEGARRAGHRGHHGGRRRPAADARRAGDALLEIPPCPELLSPFLTVIPLQLLAYHIALRAGMRRRPAPQPRQDRHGRVGTLS